MFEKFDARGEGPPPEMVRWMRRLKRAGQIFERASKSTLEGLGDGLERALEEHAEPIVGRLQAVGAEVPLHEDGTPDTAALHAALEDRHPHVTAYLALRDRTRAAFALILDDLRSLDGQRAEADAELATREPDAHIPRVMTVEQAADIIEVHPETIRRSIRSGELKAAKIGRDYRIAREDLSAWFVERGGAPLFRDEGGAFEPTPANIRQAGVAWLSAHKLKVSPDNLDRIAQELDGYTGGVLGLTPLAHLDLMHEHGVLTLPDA